MKESILITGGTGYIGSHTAVELMKAGQKVIIIDNLCNSNIQVLEHLEKLCGRQFIFIEADVRNDKTLDYIFQEYPISGVIHFAGLKSVNESVEQPIRYFDNNVGSTLALLKSMDRANVRRIVFSSSATVYGTPKEVPIKESSELYATTPYGRSKLMCEEILSDLQATDKRWHIATLRYFNPVGAHPSGLIGEHPNGIPNNLMPYITQVAIGKREFLNIFGGDYPTHDGTGIRDYIHVVDLAQGHLAALNYLHNKQTSITANLGKGKGVSVKQLVDTFSRVNKINVPYKIIERRVGDIACCYANTSLAEKELNWRAKLDLEQMCRDSWCWQTNYPNGYI
jgi:UDP-glucose 4-epimerase